MFSANLKNKGLKPIWCNSQNREFTAASSVTKIVKIRTGFVLYKGDSANEYIDMMLDADGIILGSPVYFQHVTPEMKGSYRLCGEIQRRNV
jgi:hypothetical protein